MTAKSDWVRQQPFAHRGLHDAAQGIIENTTTAYSRAIKAGVGIECDLQISADGEAMVFHDPELERLTKRVEKLNTLNAAEIKTVEFKGTADKIQTLSELVEQVGGKVPMLIELKTLRDGSTRLVERALEILSAYPGPFGIMSFDPTLIAAAMKIAPDVVRGAVVMPQTEKYWLRSTAIDGKAAPLLETLNPDFVSYDHRGFPSRFSDGFRDAGKPVVSWTIRDQKTADFAYQHSDQITFEGFTPK
jgi:glycerophosphoryl diester phosphodiesterase